MSAPTNGQRYGKWSTPQGLKWGAPMTHGLGFPGAAYGPPVSREIPQNLPPPQMIMPNAPVAMPQGGNAQAGLLAQNNPMQTLQLRQMMQGLNSPYLRYLNPQQ